MPLFDLDVVKHGRDCGRYLMPFILYVGSFDILFQINIICPSIPTFWKPLLTQGFGGTIRHEVNTIHDGSYEFFAFMFD